MTTKDDIETMRILFGAQIGELCNQERWNDAKEMECIRDRLIQALESQDSDCISRKEVLKRIEESVAKYSGQYSTDMLNMWGLFSQMITELPSVAPKQVGKDGIKREFQEIVAEYVDPDLCTYPEYRGKPYYSIKYLENGTDEIIGFGTYKPKVLSQYIRDYFISVTPMQGWILVSERLPEDGTWNIFTDGNMVSVERYKTDAIDHFYPNGRWFSLDEVIAWMPLPEPYKAESEDKE